MRRKNDDFVNGRPSAKCQLLGRKATIAVLQAGSCLQHGVTAENQAKEGARTAEC